MDHETKLLNKLKDQKPEYTWTIEDVDVRGTTTRILVSTFKDKEAGFALPPHPERKSIKVLISTIISMANTHFTDELDLIAEELEKREL